VLLPQIVFLLFVIMPADEVMRPSSIYCLVYRDIHRTSPLLAKFCSSYLFKSIKGRALINFSHVLQVAKMSAM